MQRSQTLSPRKSGPAQVRNTVLVTRVSTPRQAENDEGSLKNQLQRLRGYLDYRRSCNEVWREIAHVELRAISGKDSIRSLEFQTVFELVRTNRVNTVLCPALDRVCRSVADFLALFEFLSQHGVEFISLREQFDTCTPQGRFVATILMALAQMEREITSMRTSDAMADRSLRGLWNGGQLLGYDLDPERRGYLIPNPAESLLVNLSFDLYLELGSIKETAQELNRQGYRTKSYTSRRNKQHRGSLFSVSSMQYLLRNVAYLGKKPIDATGDAETRLVDAVWPPTVSKEKFNAVQQLMADNGQTHRSGASSVQHVYPLSGLVHCKRCGEKMDGESATGRLGTKYFYYRCSNQDCQMRAAAQGVEEAIVDRLQLMAQDPDLLDRLTTETNGKLQQGKPQLEQQAAGLERDLKDVKARADKLLTEMVTMDQQTGQSFIKDKLNELGQRQLDLAQGLAEVQRERNALDREAVDVEQLRATLGQVKGLYGALQPYQQKELMQRILQRAEVNEREITLEVYALTGAELPGKVAAEGAVVRMPPDWLPSPVSHRTLRVSFNCHLPSLTYLHRREKKHRIKRGTDEIVTEWQRLLDDGVVKNRAELARRIGVSRARITLALAHT
ncbi:MAG: recombinase family protein [Dehalococcoidia bacterium]